MVTVTDNIRNAYTNSRWRTGEETPLGGKIWDYENGETLTAYVCLRNRKWLAVLRHSSSFLERISWKELSGEDARMVLAAIHHDEDEIVWEIWERSETIG